jgi:hypothetical protein
MIDVVLLDPKSPSNGLNFVPVLLHSVLGEQPELSWEKIGSVRYIDAKFEDSTSFNADVIGFTFFESSVTYYSSRIRKNIDSLRINNSNAIFIAGGPMDESLVYAAMTETGIDYFFAGSALWSFRKFCEHVEKCKGNGIPLDVDYLSTLPGLYQRKGDSIISPESSVQPVDFIKKLVLDPSVLIEHNLGALPKKSRVVKFPYPMYEPCPGKCAFCAYTPVGVSLTKEQKHEYLGKIKEIEKSGRSPKVMWFGPNFDFKDHEFIDFLKNATGGGKRIAFQIMCMVGALLNPGTVGDRLPNTERINEIMSSNLTHVHFGVESFLEQERDEMGKLPFTNEELKRVISGIIEARDKMLETMKEKTKLRYPSIILFILPPDITSSFASLSSQAARLLGIWEHFLFSKSFFGIDAMWDGASIRTHINTPDFELLRIFDNSFPSQFRNYFRGWYRDIPGNEGIERIYLASVPVDPIARATFSNLNWSISKEMPWFLSAPLRSYGIFFALALYEKQYLESGVVLSKDFNEYLAKLYDMHQRLIEKFNQDDFLKTKKSDFRADLKKRILLRHQTKSEATFRWALANTPLRDPKAFELWEKLGTMRKKMTNERKRGNPEWRQAGRRLIA